MADHYCQICKKQADVLFVFTAKSCRNLFPLYGDSVKVCKHCLRRALEKEKGHDIP